MDYGYAMCYVVCIGLAVRYDSRYYFDGIFTALNRYNIPTFD